MVTRVAAVAGVLGGACWVVHVFVDSDALWWAGLALLTMALAAAGAALVSSSAAWLRVVVAVCFPLLVWSVLAVVHGGEGFGPDEGSDVVDGVAGAVGLVLAALALVRGRGRDGDGAEDTTPGTAAGPASAPGPRRKGGTRASR